MAEKLRNIVCLHCGGEVVISDDGKTATCKYCRKTYKIGSSLSDGATIDFALATEYWKTFRFADAKRKFLDVTKDDKDFAEAYWGAVVSEYGIEWGENRFGETVPTCHRAHAVSIFDDANYKKAVKLSGDEKYKDLANKIEEVRKEIIEKSSEEKDYDVFICFKATEQIDGRTRKTDDFELGREIYNELTEHGYKVFFSPETLMKVKEQEFEPYIFKALSTARVMLLLCSDNEKIESPWVKNEWGRFLDMKNGSGLIPVCGNKYEPFSPAMLPNELRKLNAIEFGAKLFTQINSKLDAYFPEKVKERELAEKRKQEELAKEKYRREREEQERKFREEREAQEKRFKELEEQERKLREDKEERERKLKEEREEQEKRYKEEREAQEKRFKELEERINGRKEYADEKVVRPKTVDNSMFSLVEPIILKNGNDLLEKGKYEEAYNEFTKVTDNDEVCGEAWLGRLLSKFKTNAVSNLPSAVVAGKDYENFGESEEVKNVLKYCSDENVLREVNVALGKIDLRKEEERKENEVKSLLDSCIKMYEESKSEGDYKKTIESLNQFIKKTAEYRGVNVHIVLAEANFLLGNCYYFGYGAKIDLDLAKIYYERAKSEDEIYSKKNSYRYGDDERRTAEERIKAISENPVKEKAKVEQYKKEAKAKAEQEKKKAEAERLKAELKAHDETYSATLKGEKLAEHLEKSVSLLSALEKLGSPDDKNRLPKELYDLGCYYEKAENYNKAFECYNKCVGTGKDYDGSALTKLGLFYFAGKGVKQDKKKAVECYEKASEVENAEAMRELGKAYYRGYDVEQDLDKSLKLLKLANKKGYDCKEYIGWVEETIAEEKKAEREKAEAEKRAQKEKAEAEKRAKEDKLNALEQKLSEKSEVGVADITEYINGGGSCEARNIFAICKNARKISVNEQVKNIGKVDFDKCENLEILDFSNDPHKLRRDFSFLKNLKIKGLYLSTLPKEWSSLFPTLSELEEIKLNESPAFAPDFYHVRNGMLIYDKGDGTILYCPPKRKAKTIEIENNVGPSAFANNKVIEILIFSKQYRLCHYDIETGAFKNCENLKTVTFENVHKVGENAFEGCKRLENVVINNDCCNVWHSAFKDCVSLKKVEFGEANVINENAFEGCKSLAEVELKRDSHVCKNAFKGTALKLVKIPRKCRIDDGAFPSDCKVKKPLFG